MFLPGLLLYICNNIIKFVTAASPVLAAVWADVLVLERQASTQTNIRADTEGHKVRFLHSPPRGYSHDNWLEEEPSHDSFSEVGG